MYIKSLKIENWKCFSESTELNFSNIEIFSFPNGSGKTAVLEAMYYGLWGKTDHKMSTYQNHEGQTKISICFDFDGVDYKIEREFPNTKAILYKNGNKYREGIKEIFEYVDNLFDFSITKRLWFKGDVSNSPVLDVNFFKDEILGEKLKEPNLLRQYYNKRARALNSELKSYNIIETRPIEEIEKEIEEVSQKIKGCSDCSSDQEYLKATQAKENHEKFALIANYFKTNNINPVDFNIVNQWEQLNLENLQKSLEHERSLFVDNILSKVGANALSNIAQHNNKNHKCVVCDGHWSDERSEYIRKVLSDGLRDQNVEDDLLRKIDFKNQYSQELINKSKEYYFAKRQADNSIKNYEEIIANYNDQINELWSQLDRLNHEKDIAVANQSTIQRIKELDKELKDCKAKVEFLKDYIQKATASYTSALLEKSSKTLNSLNNNYSGLSISPEDNELKLFVGADELFVSQISTGEKTMVALSLIYAIRDIFTPGMSLIFDESFAALSANNNSEVIDLISNSYEQIFVVTHNPDWIDYPGWQACVSDYNIRTDWS